MIYTLTKRIIESGKYEKNDMLDKLGAFLLNDSITKAQYDELSGMITGQSAY